eukprot:TRINITY_DN873_c0_g1_i2.p1 TRINITY_DN873_c0_g1~~TRINITY_DN873_c0_g1_i2.p1  ORF type:complete len:557 (+),score=59.04 TRINITY_DN873_c0_g1_i2:124-1671(+)
MENNTPFPYQVMETIGMGSYGIITSAQPPSRTDAVAIKSVPPQAGFASGTNGTNIVLEVGALVRLWGHPNICTITDIVLPPLWPIRNGQSYPPEEESLTHEGGKWPLLHAAVSKTSKSAMKAHAEADAARAAADKTGATDDVEDTKKRRLITFAHAEAAVALAGKARAACARARTLHQALLQDTSCPSVSVPHDAIQELNTLMDTAEHAAGAADDAVERARLAASDATFMYVHFGMRREPGNLWRLNQEVKIPVEGAGCIARQLVQALVAVHRVGMIHRDVSSGNVLVCPSTYRTHLADFGFVRLTAAAMTAHVATLVYMAPELLTVGDAAMSEYTSAVDMWGLGCVVADMLIGSNLMTGETRKLQFFRSLIMVGIPSEEELALCPTSVRSACATVPPGLMARIRLEPPLGRRLYNAVNDRFPGRSADVELAIDFVCRCLRWAPSHRMTADAARQHPWIVRACDVSGDVSPDWAPSDPLVGVPTGTVPANRAALRLLAQILREKQALAEVSTSRV